MGDVLLDSLPRHSVAGELVPRGDLRGKRCVCACLCGGGEREGGVNKLEVDVAKRVRVEVVGERFPGGRRRGRAQ